MTTTEPFDLYAAERAARDFLKAYHLDADDENMRYTPPTGSPTGCNRVGSASSSMPSTPA